MLEGLACGNQLKSGRRLASWRLAMVRRRVAGGAGTRGAAAVQDGKTARGCASPFVRDSCAMLVQRGTTNSFHALSKKEAYGQAFTLVRTGAPPGT